MQDNSYLGYNLFLIFFFNLEISNALLAFNTTQRWEQNFDLFTNTDFVFFT